jgi:hypothetical protein
MAHNIMKQQADQGRFERQQENSQESKITNKIRRQRRQVEKAPSQVKFICTSMVH